MPPKADIRQRIEHVCYVPEADICKSKAPGFGVQAEPLTSGLVSSLLVARLDMNKVRH